MPTTPKYRILSLDGGSPFDGNGFVAVSLLQQIQELLAIKKLSLLKVRDKGHMLFAGTSAGSITALFLAMHEAPDKGLQEALDFWGEVAESFSFRKATNLTREILFAMGCGPWFSTDCLMDVLRGRFGDKLTLGDLPHKVLITSFQLQGSKRRGRWKPKIFHNLGEPRDSDLRELVLDVAMRSSSCPIVSPIYQGLRKRGPGYIDGGVFANNPAMCAVAQAINQLIREPLRRGLAPQGLLLDQILLLSVGNGSTPANARPAMREGRGNWGYRKWMLDLAAPGRLLHLILEAGQDAIDYQCQQLLQSNYFRLQSDLVEPLIAFDADGVGTADEDLRAIPETPTLLDQAVNWLDGVAWCEPK